MSKPIAGSVAYPKSHQSPTVPKSRLPPRLLPSRPLQPQQIFPRAGVESREAQQASESASKRNLWETIVRRKYLLSAIAVGVVVVAGTLLGARLKETSQEYGKRQELEESARQLAESTTSTGTSAGLKAQESTFLHTKASETTRSSQVAGAEGSGYDLDIAKQIALLEDRRALLNRQRINFEGKIQRLRERQVRKDVMEARRSGPQSNAAVARPGEGLNQNER